MRVLGTSFLYETSPVGSPEQHAQQPRFLNAVVEIETILTPLQLLDVLQAIEQQCGRKRDANGVRNGPRTIDLDLIFYKDADFTLKDERLEVPHPRWHNRGFVLQPMHDLLSSKTGQGGADQNLLQRVEAARAQWLECQQTDAAAEKEVIYRVIPFGQHAGVIPDAPCPAHSDVWRVGREVVSHRSNSASPETFPRSIHAPTYIMGILNLTPDSFSDGGAVHTVSVDAAVAAAHRMYLDGADIIDLGGESTRPGSQAIRPQEEWQRIGPVIRAIKEKHPLIKMSVDTYRPSVARAAVEAGCVMINDIMGGSHREQKFPDGGEENMFDVARELNVPYVCMHMRGTPQTMTQPEHTTYTDPISDIHTDQIRSVQVALTPSPPISSALFAAPSPTLCRWNLLTDPGIGFAKTGSHALEILKRLSDVRVENHPILVGTSRKGFIGKVLQEGDRRVREQRHPQSVNTELDAQMEERIWGTSATVTASIAGGADIVRVHDVKEMRRVRDMADQIYKR
jgi:dihydroneopterin aldolase/2-amino-4-hydroxy-6-hydroxymethyldihydropteridine diphosphokinase/dihydropteroate synthase